MKRNVVKIVALGLAGFTAFSSFGASAQAGNLSEVLPKAGIDVALNGGATLKSIQEGAVKGSGCRGGLKLTVKELNSILETKHSAVNGTSVARASMVKDVVLTNIQPIAEEVTEETMVAEATVVQNKVAGTQNTLSIIGVLQNSPLTGVESGLDDLDFVAAETEETLVATVVSEAVATEASKTVETEETAETQERSTESAEEESAQAETEAVQVKVIEDTQTAADVEAKLLEGMTEEEKSFTNLVIAKVNNYINVRSIPSEEGEILGKLFDKSVGTLVKEENGWYQITSGNVTGYVKAEYCVTGKDAVELAKKVGTRVATVTADVLKVREDATTDSAVLGSVPMDEELTVTEEKDGWVKVNIEEGDGWVSGDYVTLRTDFVKAESKAEETARLAREEAARAAARAAAARGTSTKKTTSGNKNYNSASSYVAAGDGSAMGNAVAQYALQFVGNPYVYGGTSLTNGTDCSGFVQSVYKNFGVSLPRTSSADRGAGSAVGSLSEAQPGDLICYSGHVALYIGGGKIVHASTRKTGIIVSNAAYRNILAIRRIF